MQFGELNNHTGYEVSFAKQCGTSKFFSINFRVQAESNHICCFYEALALIVHIAQAFLEGNGGKFCQASFQGLFTVFVEEEFCVRKTSTQYAFVTMSNYVKMFFTAITNGDEFIEQATVFFQNGEVTLMFAHRSDDAFFRQRQEAFFEGAAESSRPFYQVVNFFQQIFVDFSVTAFFDCQVDNLLTNQLTTSVLVNHYEVVFQNFFVCFSAGNFYSARSFVNCGRYSIFNSANSFFQKFFSVVKAFNCFCTFYQSRTQEAVTTGEFAGFNASDFNRDYVVAKESNQPTDGANETEVMVSPTHGFGEA